MKVEFEHQLIAINNNSQNEVVIPVAPSSDNHQSVIVQLLDYGVGKNNTRGSTTSIRFTGALAVSLISTTAVLDLLSFNAYFSLPECISTNISLYTPISRVFQKELDGVASVVHHDGYHSPVSRITVDRSTCTFWHKRSWTLWLRTALFSNLSEFENSSILISDVCSASKFTLHI